MNDRQELILVQCRGLLRSILQLLLALSEWYFLAGNGGPTRPAYFGLRDAIMSARKEIGQ